MISEFLILKANASQKTYIRAKGVRFDEKPVVLFEDLQQF